RPPAHDPCDAAERREDLRRLVADVRRLPDQQRSALLMREMDGMSYADLAHALDTSVPAVKSLLVRARIGLVEAIEARDADCADIRYDLAASYDKGVRSSGRARKHLRDCDGCTTYRTQLRGLRQGFAALSPALAAPGLLAKLLSLGGATSGAGVAAGGATSGTTAAIGGGAAAAVSVSKVAAIVCSAAAITGGAVEVKKIVAPAPRAASQPIHQGSTAVAAPSADALRGSAGADLPPAIRRTIVPAEDLALHPSIPMGPSLAPLRENANGSGGTLAPSDELAAHGTAAPAEPAATDDGETMIPIGEDVALPLEGEGSTTTTDGEHPPSKTSSSTGDSTTTGSSTTGFGTSNGSAASASTSGDTGTASGSTTASSSAGHP
ncbi:MAG: sigma-70 family RNA polymerase sigma factor, partial [Solirubrobacteraceae bacterium]